jgi:DNA-binding NarL/FixJ family response regulator
MSEDGGWMDEGDRSSSDPRKPAKPRILLADDHPGLLVAFCRLLAPSFDIVGYAVDGREVVETVKRTRPDVALVDLNLPRVDGFECCCRIKAAVPATKVIMLTADDHVALRERASEVGASSFVVKHRAPDDLIAVIDRVLRQDAEGCESSPLRRK